MKSRKTITTTSSVIQATTQSHKQERKMRRAVLSSSRPSSAPSGRGARRKGRRKCGGGGRHQPRSRRRSGAAECALTTTSLQFAHKAVPPNNGFAEGDGMVMEAAAAFAAYPAAALLAQAKRAETNCASVTSIQASLHVSSSHSLVLVLSPKNLQLYALPQ